MSKKKTNLAWIDLEMTGLEDDHVIIEIASLVTNSNLIELAEGPVIAIHRKPEEINNIKEDVSEIKDMLRQFLSKQNGN